MVVALGSATNSEFFTFSPILARTKMWLKLNPHFKFEGRIRIFNININIVLRHDLRPKSQQSDRDRSLSPSTPSHLRNLIRSLFLWITSLIRSFFIVCTIILYILLYPLTLYVQSHHSLKNKIEPENSTKKIPQKKSHIFTCASEWS